MRVRNGWRLGLMALWSLGLAGCAGPHLARTMSAYVGKPESALVAALGVPASRTESGGITYDRYERTITYSVPGWVGGPLFVDQRPAIGGIPPVVPPQTYHNTCTVTFAIVGGVVRSYTAHGSVC